MNINTELPAAVEAPMAGGPQAKAKRGKKKPKRRKKGPKQTNGHPATTGQQSTTEPNTDSRVAAADAGDVASVSTTTVPTERAPSGQIQGRPGGRGRERGRAERRGMTPQVIERFCAELKQQPSELVVTKLAEKLYERKKDKICTSCHSLVRWPCSHQANSPRSPLTYQQKYCPCWAWNGRWTSSRRRWPARGKAG